MRTRAPLLLLLAALPAVAQQSGSITGRITRGDGQGLPGVRIEATCPMLPLPRRITSDANGAFRLPMLPPGAYELTFSHPAQVTAKRSARVTLQQQTTLDVALADAAAPGAVVEVVASATLVDATSAELKAFLTTDVIRSLPQGRDYRDLIRLVPGVPYTQDQARGPSAGGSGQDNVHSFDGVNVNLPLFGTLSAEPSAHDIDQVAVVKGGATATDFNRSAGYAVNTTSRSGTRAFQGELAVRTLPSGLVARRTPDSPVQYEEDRRELVASLGGPVIPERLFFFVSAYRPDVRRENGTNLYGPVPDHRSTRQEFFGKLTFAPAPDLLVHASHRTSARDYRAANVAGPAYAPSTSSGGRVTLDISILEALWTLGPASFLSLKASAFANRTLDRPDRIVPLRPALDGSVALDVQALASQGLLQVPVPAAPGDPDAAAYNAFIAPIVAAYGYADPATGAATGGGYVGAAAQFNTQDFTRQSWQLAWDGARGAHELHVGFQRTRDTEDLLRTSNGWGLLTAPRSVTFGGAPVAFQAQVQQQGLLGVPTLHSEYVSENLELNDRIRWRDLTVNLGLLASRDRLYGQGLRESPGTLSGFALAKGNRYLMKEIRPQDALQPRLGLTWAYRRDDTVYASYARYVPAASSLPRAASWARGSASTINAWFDSRGSLLGTSPEASSQGKLFVPGIKPRSTDEYLVGTTRDFGGGLSARLHARYRYSTGFWEDTMNDARVKLDPPAGIPRTLYIPGLGTMLAELGGGSDSSFVVTRLDGAFTKYYEAGLEAEWRGTGAYLRASYVWSHYYGNFDQDNTTVVNDANLFIGSTFIADDAGRQLWNFKYGNLTGDRRHQVKLYGYWNLPWEGRIGAYAVYQSGQPWQYQSWEPYRDLTANRSDTNRYAEPAGSHTTAAHHQLDLSYTQTLLRHRGLTLEATLDVFNVFNRQTGYNVQTCVHTALAGTPQSFFAPRRLQGGLRLAF